MNKVFNLIYSDPRKTGKRKSRHKCVMCNQIITDGEKVIMGRKNKGSKVIHDICAQKTRPDGVGYTWGVWFAWLFMAKDVRGTQGGWFKETIEEYIERTNKIRA